MTAATRVEVPMAITMGDPAGIGPEIIVKLAADTKRPPLPFVVIGDIDTLRRATGIVGARLHLAEVDESFAGWTDAWRRRALPVLQHGPALPADLPPGRVDARAGAASFAYVVRAVDLALAGRISALVTAPINKEALRAASITYPGHTEILAERSGTRDFAMLLANDELKVLLVSIHVPLLEAIRSLTLERESRAIRLAHQACVAFGIDRPRVAVAGLNPHAGENGMFGSEDLAVIAPAVASARASGIDATGPWPADTVFMRARRGEFDIVVAQYHDQGLIPVKYLGVDHGVNITVGLPFVRTSVDHGTAFDIAGTGRADHASLAHALQQAAALSSMKPPRSPQASTTRNYTERTPGAPALIFMLTRQDRTVADAHARLAEALAAGVRHIGFKDVGLPIAQLHTLAEAIRAGGARSYLEVVSLDAASELASAQTAVALGIDVLMGGTRPKTVLPVIRGTAIHYYPFPGRIAGHPSVLEGTTAEIVDSARQLAQLDGIHGLDLLAYRFAGDAPDLIRQVCAAVAKPVIVAGSIDRAERIRAVVAGGGAAFTVGTAALDEVFPALASGLSAQLQSIQDLLTRELEEASAPRRNAADR